MIFAGKVNIKFLLLFSRKNKQTKKQDSVLLRLKEKATLKFSMQMDGQQDTH